MAGCVGHRAAHLPGGGAMERQQQQEGQLHGFLLRGPTSHSGLALLAVCSPRGDARRWCPRTGSSLWVYDAKAESCVQLSPGWLARFDKDDYDAMGTCLETGPLAPLDSQRGHAGPSGSRPLTRRLRRCPSGSLEPASPRTARGRRTPRCRGEWLGHSPRALLPPSPSGLLRRLESGAGPTRRHSPVQTGRGGAARERARGPVPHWRTSGGLPWGHECHGRLPSLRRATGRNGGAWYNMLVL